MNDIFTLLKVSILTVIISTGCTVNCHAQKLLNKQISIAANRQPVSEVLKTISSQGGFYFSYGGDVVPADSLVTITIDNKPVREILDVLLTGQFQYKETGNYIIIQRARQEKSVYISGKILDAETGKEVDYASIYSRTFLVSALSDDHGSFRVKLKERPFPVTLSVSKVGYADTSMVIQSELQKDLNIVITPRAIDLDEVLVVDYGGDRTWLARLFVSSRLRRQSRNIGRFFVSLPYQASLTPGLGTHGKMSSQVINKFSLNLLGGYTGGVQGVEIAGGFNISKNEVSFLQIAGVFNIVSKSAAGVQTAGLYNHVLDSLTGVQVAGFGNVAGKYVSGVQAAGFFNKALSVKGVQVAGAFNVVRNGLSGLQVSGLGNIGKKEVKGLQLAPFNYAGNLKGTQIGIVNIADSTSGYSIGIINIIKHGKSEISVYSNEIVPFNVVWKTGNQRIYTILLAGSSVNPNKKAYVFGIGVGKEFRLNNRLKFITEITNQNVYAGNWENAPVLYRLQTALGLKLSKRLLLSAGPSFTIMTPRKSEVQKDYQTFPPKSYGGFAIGEKASSWLGWQAGLSWQYGHFL
ncbi:STN and carboxypeptidase regulatory-like domain-containing protein [Dyadobacter sp. NIV53]|uniref:STN and carboxypeptidase regulatory-like domain-containing protein n=1 Tax=Dyadobacter sp. NIV53 TaxID=2861765 RepID=UPI001C8812C0|nr:STN and carboxypeptidase regulatory-like domain-containing protein [Dyadobacter sp. NIV53]